MLKHVYLLWRSAHNDAVWVRLASRVSVLHRPAREVYEWSGRPLVTSAVAEGRNATILVYGATGAGKTHTMFGTDGDFHGRGGASRRSAASCAALEALGGPQRSCFIHLGVWGGKVSGRRGVEGGSHAVARLPAPLPRGDEPPAAWCPSSPACVACVRCQVGRSGLGRQVAEDGLAGVPQVPRASWRTCTGVAARAKMILKPDPAAQSGACGGSGAPPPGGRRACPEWPFGVVLRRWGHPGACFGCRFAERGHSCQLGGVCVCVSKGRRELSSALAPGPLSPPRQ